MTNHGNEVSDDAIELAQLLYDIYMQSSKEGDDE